MKLIIIAFSILQALNRNIFVELQVALKLSVSL